MINRMITALIESLLIGELLIAGSIFPFLVMNRSPSTDHSYSIEGQISVFNAALN